MNPMKCLTQQDGCPEGISKKREKDTINLWEGSVPFSPLQHFLMTKTYRPHPFFNLSSRSSATTEALCPVVTDW